MANLQERRDKSGKLISFSIRIFRGRGPDGRQLKPWTTTFPVSASWTEKTARKRAEAFAANFERDCKMGLTSDDRQQFAAYADYVIDLKERRGLKHSTICRYRELLARINPALGSIKVKDLRVDMLNDFYSALGENGVNLRGASALAKIDLVELLKKRKLTRARVAELCGISDTTVSAFVNGRSVSAASAKLICDALSLNMERVAEVTEGDRRLSSKTIREHHALIHTVLQQAVKEGIVPFNVADRVDLPRAERREPNYFSAETALRIRDALETESLMWRALVHLLLITGMRRGEVLGLKWSVIDFLGCRLHIENNVLYKPDRGIYEDQPKTAASIRWVTVPRETMLLLREWQMQQNTNMVNLGDYYNDGKYLFTQDNGKPLHPDSVTNWLKEFSKRHGLPHLNPHAFRHSMASLLYFNGVDSVTISKRLGHAQVSTTANIYAHIMEKADQQSADILAEVILKKA